MKGRIPKRIREILDKVKERLNRAYGKRLKGIILYGSYARGDASGGSDIDIIVLLRNMKDNCKEILRASAALGDLELEYDTLISIIPFDVRDFRRRKSPVILNAKREGVLI